ncbi:hypothetical protein GALL_486910 [mine drainage metagenome]|uniref:Uncharacterized protein n=1 Tax=mine drainage metagenome TaxID=410659 RepID=A0A1J5PFZ1_9ZZZZ
MGTVKGARHRFVQCVVDQCRFARTRDTGDAGEQAHRKDSIDKSQIVATGTYDLECLVLALRCLVPGLACCTPKGCRTWGKARGFVFTGHRRARAGQPGGALAGYFYLQGLCQILAGQRCRVGFDLLECALRHDAPTVHPRARPQIDDVVGGTHHVFVMFNHQHAVANVPQMLEGVNQAVVVALVQANAGFVEHVHDTGQA